MRWRCWLRCRAPPAGLGLRGGLASRLAAGCVGPVVLARSCWRGGWGGVGCRVPGCPVCRRPGEAEQICQLGRGSAWSAPWGAVLAWLRSGARFELVALDVTAGADVAFAHALLRCGEPAELAAHPERRLRVTFGLRKEEGRWKVGACLMVCVIDRLPCRGVHK
ncbi:nuclear transport factor 2 family protein [Catenuloplanes nepalensis]|uniref:nuclear transport factor 2 family protein n=1 Tax=Catenuloplanes nepalensis TaxID=587533 RepID=UPI003520F9D0